MTTTFDRLAAGVIRTSSRLPGTTRAVEIATYRLGRRLERRSGGELVRAALLDGPVALGHLEHADYRRTWIHGVYEPELTELFAAVIRPGDIAIDVGANIGLHALRLAAAVGTRGRVHAFEPLPTAADVLEASIEANGYGLRLLLHRCALAATPGELTLHVGGNGGVTSSLIAHDWLGERLTVPVETLDGALLDVLDAPPRLLKIDVEGKELDVLLGARELLARFPPEYLVLEFTSAAPAEPLLDFVRAHGYEPLEPLELPAASGAAPGEPGFGFVNGVFRRSGTRHTP